MRRAATPLSSLLCAEAPQHGTFVAPTIIEIAEFADLQQEVFGPVLHVLRFPRDGLDQPG